MNCEGAGGRVELCCLPQMNKIPPQIKAETLRPILFHSFSCCLCLKGQHKLGSP